jgi:hypothetical protein
MPNILSVQLSRELWYSMVPPLLRRVKALEAKTVGLDGASVHELLEKLDAVEDCVKITTDEASRHAALSTRINEAASLIAGLSPASLSEGLGALKALESELAPCAQQARSALSVCRRLLVSSQEALAIGGSIPDHGSSHPCKRRNDAPGKGCSTPVRSDLRLLTDQISEARTVSLGTDALDADVAFLERALDAKREALHAIVSTKEMELLGGSPSRTLDTIEQGLVRSTAACTTALRNLEAFRAKLRRLRWIA